MELSEDEKIEQENLHTLIAVLKKLTGGPVPEIYTKLAKNPSLFIALQQGKTTPEQQDMIAGFSEAIAIFHELDKVKHSHRSLIVTTNSFIEAMVTALVNEHCLCAKRISSRTEFTHAARTIVLVEKGVITEALFKRIDWLNNLRNYAAHQFPFTVGEDKLNEYKKLQADCGDIHQICTALLNDILTVDTTLFFKRFCGLFSEMLEWLKTNVNNINKMASQEELVKVVKELNEEKKQGEAKAAAATAKKKPAASKGKRDSQ